MPSDNAIIKKIMCDTICKIYNNSYYKYPFVDDMLLKFIGDGVNYTPDPTQFITDNTVVSYEIVQHGIAMSFNYRDNQQSLCEHVGYGIYCGSLMSNEHQSEQSIKLHKQIMTAIYNDIRHNNGNDESDIFFIIVNSPNHEDVFFQPWKMCLNADSRLCKRYNKLIGDSTAPTVFFLERYEALKLIRYTLVHMHQFNAFLRYAKFPENLHHSPVTEAIVCISNATGHTMNRDIIEKLLHRTKSRLVAVYNLDTHRDSHSMFQSVFLKHFKPFCGYVKPMYHKSFDIFTCGKTYRFVGYFYQDDTSMSYRHWKINLYEAPCIYQGG